MPDSQRGLSWSHGTLSVQRLGAMMAPVCFLLDGQRQVCPMHIAPWADEPGAAALPGILRRLRGDWPCVPFGAAAPLLNGTARWAADQEQVDGGDNHVHGYASNHDWDWCAAPSGQLVLAIDYPTDSPVHRLERRIEPVPGKAAVDLHLSIQVRRDCRLPIGLHPVFRLPARTGAACLEPPLFSQGLSYPGTLEPGAALIAPDQAFSDLAQLRRRDGGLLDATVLPLADEVEELLQLNDVEGHCSLAYADERYRVRLHWQKEHFPSLLLWLSNHGRKAEPWRGRHLALGIEPVCSPFGLNIGTALADNPIARSGTPTARAFTAGETFVTRYRIEVEDL